jgi:hypothetical protein
MSTHLRNVGFPADHPRQPSQQCTAYDSFRMRLSASYTYTPLLDTWRPLTCCIIKVKNGNKHDFSWLYAAPQQLSITGKSVHFANHNHITNYLWSLHLLLVIILQDNAVDLRYMRVVQLAHNRRFISQRCCCTFNSRSGSCVAMLVALAQHLDCDAAALHAKKREGDSILGLTGNQSGDTTKES